jgi:hypothetical protein
MKIDHLEVNNCSHEGIGGALRCKNTCKQESLVKVPYIMLIGMIEDKTNADVVDKLGLSYGNAN